MVLKERSPCNATADGKETVGYKSSCKSYNKTSTHIVWDYRKQGTDCDCHYAFCSRRHNFFPQRWPQQLLLDSGKSQSWKLKYISNNTAFKPISKRTSYFNCVVYQNQVKRVWQNDDSQVNQTLFPPCLAWLCCQEVWKFCSSNELNCNLSQTSDDTAPQKNIFIHAPSCFTCAVHACESLVVTFTVTGGCKISLRQAYFPCCSCSVNDVANRVLINSNFLFP